MSTNDEAKPATNGGNGATAGSSIFAQRLPSIGLLMHLHIKTPEGGESCGFGWVSDYDKPKTANSPCAILGISGRGVFSSNKVRHNPKPSALLVAGEPSGVASATWHWPEECPWQR